MEGSAGLLDPFWVLPPPDWRREGWGESEPMFVQQCIVRGGLDRSHNRKDVRLQNFFVVSEEGDFYKLGSICIFSGGWMGD